jgi:putative ABC transport system permease protein
MRSLLQDFRYGLRMLGKNVAFTAVAVLSLALGIGANSTVFSIVDGMVLRPWPVQDPEELVSIYSGTEKEPLSASSYPDYLDIRNQGKVFSGILAYGKRGAFVNARGEGEEVSIDVVSDDYFSVLGVGAVLGRTFTPGSDQGGEEPGAVISYALWQRRFGGNPGVVGRPFELDGRNFTLLGVAPRQFLGLERGAPTDVWGTRKLWIGMVSGTEQEFQTRDNRWFSLVARLRSGATIQQAKSQLETIASRLAQAYPATNKGTRFLMRSEADRTREVLADVLFLMSMVSLVLLIACANVAGLLLARNEQRRKEVAIRLAVGSGSVRLIRQLLAESGLLALLGGALGLLLAGWLIKLTPTLLRSLALPSGSDIRLDARVVVFTAVLTLLTTVIFGLVPAIQASKCDLVTVLKGEEVELGRGLRRLALRKLLVVGEIALSVILLTGAGLLVRSLLQTLAVNPGFDPNKNVVLLTMAPPTLYGFKEHQASALYESLTERLGALPGVRRASYARRPPLAGYEEGETEAVLIPGNEARPGVNKVDIRFNIVSPDYLPTKGTTIIRGRGFDRRDSASSPKVVIINDTMARRFWPQADPVGRWLRIEHPGSAIGTAQPGVVATEYEIIGVAEGGKYVDLHTPPEPYLFFPFSQKLSFEASLFVETAGDPRDMLDSIMREARAASQKVPIVSGITLRQHMRLALSLDRMVVALLGNLGLLGMFLAAVGLYGVVSYAVSRRTHEIGIRMALGAERGDVTKLVQAEGVRLILLGILVGVVIALGVARTMSSMLYGIRPTDPVAFAGGCLVVIAISLLASYIPARRATNVDPMQALRYQ